MHNKGFCLAYYSLSYRRKFIRTLWVMALSPILLLLPRLPGALIQDLKVYVGIFLLTIVTGVIQAIYNYNQWKKEAAVPRENS